MLFADYPARAFYASCKGIFNNDPSHFYVLVVGQGLSFFSSTPIENLSPNHEVLRKTQQSGLAVQKFPDPIPATVLGCTAVRNAGSMQA
jgi:hypothetical protein